MTIDLLYIKFLAQGQRITTDTRKIESGQLFFALKGANFDGNEYALKALESGAKYAIVDDPKLGNTHPNVILVEDVLQTLQQLALHHRRRLNIPIIAITGSNGKTTTKELVKEVLSKKYRVAYTKGNLNNHIGVPLTLLDIKANDDFAIIEMGANHEHEIASYCLFTEPNYGIITNIGRAHLEGFGSIEGVIRAKTELYQYLETQKGVIFVNKDDETLMNHSQNCTKIEYSLKDSQVYFAPQIQSTPYLNVETKLDGKSLEIHTQLSGAYNLYNVLVAIAIGNYFEVSAEDIKLAVESYKPTNSRSQIVIKNSNTIILDAYNANPSSMDVALVNLESIEGPKIALLGAMKELGSYSEKEHKTLVQKCLKSDLTQMVFVGKEFLPIETSSRCLYFDTSEEARNWFLTSDIHHTTILVKGSRSVGLEKIIDND